jgi:hypothetical protein
MKECNSQDEFRGIVYEASLIHGYLNCYFKDANVALAGLVSQAFSVDAAVRNDSVKLPSTSSATTRCTIRSSSSTL